MKKISYLFLFFICSLCLLQAEPIVIATYNIRNANAEDSTNGNGWGQRCPYIASLIQFHGFDIFGTQEGKVWQLQDLKGAMPGYDYIGIGRDDGKEAGEYSAIFFRTDKFDVLEHGDFWLSEVTDRPNNGWDAVLPRICTWGKFRDRKTGFTFLFFNLHMDHIGVQARSESAKLILRKIKEQPPHIPVILTGDFNVDQNNESYHLLNNSGVLRDSYEMADFRYVPNGTFNDFHTDLKTDSRIDHLFLTDNFKVMKYGILTDTYRAEVTDEQKKTVTSGNFPKEVTLQKHTARIPSDHFPVMIVVDPIIPATVAPIKDWAQFRRYADANRTVQTSPKAVFMGNSITDGWWPTDSTFFINNKYVDRGISGQTSAEMLVRFRADVLDLTPKSVVILAGINDIAQNNGFIALEHVFGNIVSMAELAKAQNIKVLICSVLPAYDFLWRPGLEPAGKVIKLNAMLKDYAAKNKLTYVDYYSALVDERGGLPAKYSKDGVHPTLEGYKIMESIIQKAISNVVLTPSF